MAKGLSPNELYMHNYGGWWRFFHTYTPSLPGLYKMLVSNIKRCWPHTKLPHMIQNSHVLYKTHITLSHVIQSSHMLYKALPHIIQSSRILYHTFYKASIYCLKPIECSKCFIVLFFCATSIHRRYQTRKSCSDGTKERSPRPWFYRMSSTTVEW